MKIMEWKNKEENICKNGTEKGEIILERIYGDRAKITLELTEISKKNVMQ